MIFPADRKIFSLFFTVCLLLGLSASAAWADINVSVTPFILGARDELVTYLFPDTDKEMGLVPKAVQGTVAECLDHISGIKRMRTEGKTDYTITVSATIYSKQLFTVAQARNSSGILVAVYAALLYPQVLQKEICDGLIRPLSDKIFHPPQVAGGSMALQDLISGISYLNNESYESAYPFFYKILADNPHDADALYWLAIAYTRAKFPGLARQHALEFIAAFPNDSRRAKLEALMR